VARQAARSPSVCGDGVEIADGLRFANSVSRHVAPHMGTDRNAGMTSPVHGRGPDRSGSSRFPGDDELVVAPHAIDAELVAPRLECIHDLAPNLGGVGTSKGRH